MRIIKEGIPESTCTLDKVSFREHYIYIAERGDDIYHLVHEGTDSYRFIHWATVGTPHLHSDKICAPCQAMIKCIDIALELGYAVRMFDSEVAYLKYLIKRFKILPV